MSKSVLVMDTPKSCFYCDCCHTKDYNPMYKIDGEKFCGIENENVDFYYQQAYEDNYVKPDWCPLKELPSKHRFDKSFRDANADKIRSMTNEELAEFLTKVNAAYAEPCMLGTGNCKHEKTEKDCVDCFLEWLQTEIK